MQLPHFIGIIGVTKSDEKIHLHSIIPEFLC